MEKRVHFDEIRNNTIKSSFLILVFFLVVVGIGAIVGLLWGSLFFGITITFIFALIYTLIVYFSGKNMILSMTGAKPVTKKEYPYLYHTVEGLSYAAGIPTPKCYVIESNAVNAFATGRNPEEGVVVVTTGLLKKMNREELEGVIAHEIGHIKNYDIRTMMLAAVLTGVIILLADFFLRSVIWGGGSQNRDGRAQVIMIIVGLVLAILAPFIAQLIKLAISRKREYAADATAAVLTRNPRGLANALRRIKEDTTPFEINSSMAHLCISSPKRKKSWFKDLLSTHPPIDERIKRLEAM
ncbi:MAG: M48 family metalloprotease [Candidatus Woesearchaeota archaeon]